MLLFILLVEGPSTRRREQSSRKGVTTRLNRVRRPPPPHLTARGRQTPGGELSVSAVPSHHTRPTQNGVASGEARAERGEELPKKARGSPGELGPATASPAALRLYIV